MGDQLEFETKFVWDHGGNEVHLCIFRVAGNLTLPMMRKDSGVFEVTTRLGQGRFEYCFSVDGRWTHDPDLPALRNEFGHFNNMIKIVAPKAVVESKNFRNRTLGEGCQRTSSGILLPTHGNPEHLSAFPVSRCFSDFIVRDGSRLGDKFHPLAAGDGNNLSRDRLVESPTVLSEKSDDHFYSLVKEEDEGEVTDEDDFPDLDDAISTASVGKMADEKNFKSSTSDGSRIPSNSEINDSSVEVTAAKNSNKHMDVEINEIKSKTDLAEAHPEHNGRPTISITPPDETLEGKPNLKEAKTEPAAIINTDACEMKPKTDSFESTSPKITESEAIIKNGIILTSSSHHQAIEEQNCYDQAPALPATNNCQSPKVYNLAVESSEGFPKSDINIPDINGEGKMAVRDDNPEISHQTVNENIVEPKTDYQPQMPPTSLNEDLIQKKNGEVPTKTEEAGKESKKDSEEQHDQQVDSSQATKKTVSESPAEQTNAKEVKNENAVKIQSASKPQRNEVRIFNTSGNPITPDVSTKVETQNISMANAQKTPNPVNTASNEIKDAESKTILSNKVVKKDETQAIKSVKNELQPVPEKILQNETTMQASNATVDLADVGLKEPQFLDTDAPKSPKNVEGNRDEEVQTKKAANNDKSDTMSVSSEKSEGSGSLKRKSLKNIFTFGKSRKDSGDDDKEDHGGKDKTLISKITKTIKKVTEPKNEESNSKKEKSENLSGSALPQKVLDESKEKMPERVKDEKESKKEKQVDKAECAQASIKISPNSLPQEGQAGVINENSKKDDNTKPSSKVFSLEKKDESSKTDAQGDNKKELPEIVSESTEPISTEQTASEKLAEASKNVQIQHSNTTDNKASEKPIENNSTGLIEVQEPKLINQNVQEASPESKQGQESAISEATPLVAETHPEKDLPISALEEKFKGEELVGDIYGSEDEVKLMMESDNCMLEFYDTAYKHTSEDSDTGNQSAVIDQGSVHQEVNNEVSTDSATNASSDEVEVLADNVTSIDLPTKVEDLNNGTSHLDEEQQAGSSSKIIPGESEIISSSLANDSLIIQHDETSCSLEMSKPEQAIDIEIKPANELATELSENIDIKEAISEGVIKEKDNEEIIQENDNFKEPTTASENLENLCSHEADASPNGEPINDTQTKDIEHIDAQESDIQVKIEEPDLSNSIAAESTENGPQKGASNDSNLIPPPIIIKEPEQEPEAIITLSKEANKSSGDLFAQISGTKREIERSRSKTELNLPTTSSVETDRDQNSSLRKSISKTKMQEESPKKKDEKSGGYPRREVAKETIKDEEKDKVTNIMPIQSPVAKRRLEELQRAQYSRKLDSVFAVIRSESVDDIIQDKKTDIKIRGMGNIQLKVQTQKKANVEKNKMDDPGELAKTQKPKGFSMPEKPARFPKPKPKQPPKPPTPPPPPKEPTPPPKEPTPPPKEKTPPAPEPEPLILFEEPPTPQKAKSPTPKPPPTPTPTHKTVAEIIESSGMILPNIGINGFNRLGRLVLKAAIESGYNVLAVNDPFMPLDHMVYMLKWDLGREHEPHSVANTPTMSRKKKNISVSLNNQGRLVIDGKEVQVFTEKIVEDIPWWKAGVNYVVECTDSIRTRRDAAKHLQIFTQIVDDDDFEEMVQPIQKPTTVKKVVVASAGFDIPTLTLGVNESSLHDNMKVLGHSASHVAAMAIVLKTLQSKFSIGCCSYTLMKAIIGASKEIKCPSLGPNLKTRSMKWDFKENLVPVPCTDLDQEISNLVPGMKGRLCGLLVYSPVPEVSMIDMTLVLEDEYDDVLREVCLTMKEAAAGSLRRVLKYVMKTSDENSASCVYLGCPQTVVFDARSSFQVDKKTVKVVLWYDAEVSYSYRIVDLVRKSQLISRCTPPK